MYKKIYPKEFITDQLSQKHRITDELGRGGQGVVYRTSDPDLLIKLKLHDGKDIDDNDEIMKFQKEFDRLYLLPLDNAMHITKPLYLLEGRAGYVMQMMRDMQPIGEWLPKRFEKKDEEGFKRPDWLSADVPLESAYPLAMYADSGGTKKRLQLLAQTALELTRLHSVGVIFMDVSPDNIFCSNHPDYNEVWLIDADNLRFETPNAKAGVITPQYGAPEVVKGESGSRAVSDSYSFALLAFKVLIMCGAYDGQRFHDDDEGGDWADDESASSTADLYVQAEHGLLPFIFDAEDTSNHRVSGLPHELVLSSELLDFFRQMFGPGRVHPWMRPSLHSLPRLLAKAADSSVPCPCCGMSFYFQPSSPVQTCLYCEEKSDKLWVATSHYYSTEGVGEKIWTWVAPYEERTKFQIPRRLLGTFEPNRHGDSLFDLDCIEDDWFIYSPAMELKIEVTDSFGEFIPLTTQWLLESQQLEDGVQLYIHAPHSVIIEIKVMDNHAI